MKNILFVIVMLCLGMVAQASETFDEQKVYNRVFRVLAQPGETSSECDIDGLDPSNSDFVRCLITMNELTTDVAHCCWGDPGLSGLNNNTWDSSLPQGEAMFMRLQYEIYNCNFYLENTTDAQASRRAEVRFMRALAYSYLLDLYGSVPFTTRSKEFNLPMYVLRDYDENGQPVMLYPPQQSRSYIYNYVVNELLSVATLLPTPGQAGNYRPDKMAAWLLLARLFLNAEVYTGTERWDDALSMAKQVIDNSSRQLCPQYQRLFMADNDGNGAEQEIIFALYEDGVQRTGYGATTYLVSACSSGGADRWNGLRARRQIVEKFDQTNGDDRYLFNSDGHTLDINETNNFFNGYGITKFTNYRSDGAAASSTSFVDTDFPLLRKAEAYLIYAEADARLNGGSCTRDGLQKLNQLRSRANAQPLTAATLGVLADEWAREFYMEGRRRTDLIRFNLYTGSSYLWQWKGGTKDGKAIDSKYCLFPLCDKVMAQREDYVQTEGYNDINKVQIAPTFVFNTPPYASNCVSLNDFTDMVFTWQKPDITDPYGYEVNYSVQMSPTGHFEVTGVDDYVNWGVGYGAYVPMSQVSDVLQTSIDTKTIDGIILSQKKVRRWSEMPAEPFDIYFRCVATIATKQSVSNVVKITVMPYINNVNSTNYYLVGAGIGDGQQTLSSDGIGSSMLPFDINTEGYNLGWGRMGSGNFSLTTYLEKNSKFWLRQMANNRIVTTDGTASGAYSDYQTSVPNTDQMFSVTEAGWYKIKYVPSPATELVDGVWIQEPSMTIEKTAAPKGMASSVTIGGSVSTVMQPATDSKNRLWRGVVSLSSPGALYFVVDGKQYGDTGFSFGYAQEGSGTITVPAGNYVVTLNTATGFYDFYDMDDQVFLNTYFPFELFYRWIENPVQNSNFVVSETEPVDMGEDWVTVCSIDALPVGMSRDGLRLVIGDSSMEMDRDCRVRSSELRYAMARVESMAAPAVSRNRVSAKRVQAYVCGSLFENGLATLVCSNTFAISMEVTQYYLVGSANGWDLTDETYPMTTSDGSVYHIDLVPSLWDGFVVTPKGNTDWEKVLFCSYSYANDVCRGGFGLQSEGAWNSFCVPSILADVSQVRFTLDYSTMTWRFAAMPSVVTSINAPTASSQVQPSVFSPSGMRRDGLKPGLNIIRQSDGTVRKLMVK